MELLEKGKVERFKIYKEFEQTLTLGLLISTRIKFYRIQSSNLPQKLSFTQFPTLIFYGFYIIHIFVISCCKSFWLKKSYFTLLTVTRIACSISTAMKRLSRVIFIKYL